MSVELNLVLNGLNNPKSSQGIFDLPCGFLDEEGALHTEVKVREMTGNEEDLLTSKATPFHKKMNELLARCIERIGTITDPAKIVAAVPELTIGDRTFLVFAIRRVSLGEEFHFHEKCSECKKESLFSVNIGDLDLKRMPDPSKRLFENKMPSGKVVRYRTMIGRDEERLAKIAKVDDPLSVTMQMRVESIDGQPATLADLKKLSLKDRNFLREKFEDTDGGVDTSAEMQCPNCNTEFKSDIDVSQVGFFFPSAMKKTSNQKSST